MGGGMGLVLALVSIAVLLPTDGAAGVLVVLATVALVLAVPLGWQFAPRALRPGTRNALAAAAGVTALAVPLGAVLIGLAMVAGSFGSGGWSDGSLLGVVGTAFGGLLFVVVAGLFLFGLPLACAAFVVAGVWVVLLRELAPALGVEAPARPWG